MMLASDFPLRIRATDAAASVELRSFVQFDERVLAGAGLPDAARRFLAQVGLPERSGPDMEFQAYSAAELEVLTTTLPAGYFPIGLTYLAQPIAIGRGSGEVRYFDAGNKGEGHMINSSLEAFAESLCLYEECTPLVECHCASTIRAIDARSVTDGSYWHSYACAHSSAKPSTARGKRLSGRIGLVFVAALTMFLVSKSWSNGWLSPNRPFDADSWGQQPGLFDSPSIRKTMVDDIVDSQMLIGLRRSEVIDMLGSGHVRGQSENASLCYILGPLSFAVHGNPDSRHMRVDFAEEVVTRVHVFDDVLDPSRFSR